MTNKKILGLPAYQGYEYQIEVSVWVALTLILEKGLCTQIEIEPASQEDIFAKLNVSPDNTLTTIKSQIEMRDVDIQIKLKRTGPWSTRDFSELIDGPKQQSKVTSGPERRLRPIESLKKSSQYQYLLITNAEVHSDLKEFVVNNIGVPSSATSMPPHLKMPSSCVQETFSSRIGILEQCLPDLIKNKSECLLRELGHIPSNKIPCCLKELHEQIRDCLLGRKTSILTKDNIIKILRHFGGFPEPSQAMVSFVAPNNYSDLKSYLEEKNKLILLGPPGIGKTLVADMLAFLHRIEPDPFEIIYEDGGPGQIREYLSRPGRYLFYLRDPWGSYKLASDADQWVSELPKLLGQAGPDKKFLITSRTPILEEAFGIRGSQTISNNTVCITENNYDEQKRREILTKNMITARPWQIDFIKHHNKKILNELMIPFSLEVFANTLKEIDNESKVDIKELLDSSKIEVISKAVVQHIKELSWDANSSAVILWVLFSIEKSISKEQVHEFRQFVCNSNQNIKIDLTKLLKWLENAGWIKLNNDRFELHPMVLAGLELLIEEEPAIAEDTISALLRGLTSQNKMDLVQRIVSNLHGRQLPIPLVVQDALNNYLLMALDNASENEYQKSFYNLVEWSTSIDPVSLLCQGLIIKKVLKSKNTHLGFHYWEFPQWILDSIKEISSSDQAYQTARKFIRLILPNLDEFYSSEDFLSLFDNLGWDLSSDFLYIANKIIGAPCLQADLILNGAMSGSNPPYDELINLVMESYKEAEQWWENYKEEYNEATQAQIDAGYANFVEEELGNHYIPIDDALVIIVSHRRNRDGFNWILKHPYLSSLISPWSKIIIESKSCSTEELQAFCSVCPKKEQGLAWKCIASNKCIELEEILITALVDIPNDQLAECLQAFCMLYNPKALEEKFNKVYPFLSSVRKIAIAFISRDLELPDNDREHYLKVIEGFLLPEEFLVLNTCYKFTKNEENVKNIVSQFNSVYLSLLEQLAKDGPDLFAVCALSILAILEQQIENYVPRLLSSDEWKIRSGVLYALYLRNSKTIRNFFWDSLKDPDYHCRRFALQVLAQQASKEEQIDLLKMATDKSAPVREACAKLIGDYKWKSGLSVLCDLLLDKRNASNDTFNNIKDYHVARAAADALMLFKQLPKTVINRLANLLKQELKKCDDIEVPYKLIDIISRHQGDYILELLEQYLNNQRRIEGFKNRSFSLKSEAGWFDQLQGINEKQSSYPLRYAAAWGLITYLENNTSYHEKANIKLIAEAAGHSDGRLAGPALVVLCLLGERAWPALRIVLSDNEATLERKFLVVVTYRLIKNILPDEILNKLSESEYPGLQLLKWIDQLPTLENDTWKELLNKNPNVSTWLQTIQSDSDVNGLLRYIISGIFQNQSLDGLEWKDLRKNELPHNLEVMTMRSMLGGE